MSEARYRRTTDLGRMSCDIWTLPGGDTGRGTRLGGLLWNDAGRSPLHNVMKGMCSRLRHLRGKKSRRWKATSSDEEERTVGGLRMVDRHGPSWPHSRLRPRLLLGISSSLGLHRMQNQPRYREGCRRTDTGPGPSHPQERCRGCANRRRNEEKWEFEEGSCARPQNEAMGGVFSARRD